MRITDVSINMMNLEQSKLLAVASIVIDNEIAVHGIRIIDGSRGIFVAMPSKRNPDGTFTDIVHPTNSFAGELIRNTILDAFNKLKEE